MKITKTNLAALTQFPPDIERINAFAKTNLTLDDVYTFSVLLCDNDVDRDFERFSESALSELAELFIGKSGILDHEWKTNNQVARIYHTEIVREERKNSVGLPYVFLKGFAYLLRSEANKDLIADIEAGIKKETSVGCSVADSTCSICGQDSGTCAHISGQTYEGKLCFAELSGAVDAYEWSFVAVPAQRNAGVLKKFAADVTSLKAFVNSPDGLRFATEFAELSKLADTGKKYTDDLRSETSRLALLCDREFFDALQTPLKFMDASEIETTRKALKIRLAQMFPPVTQLPGKNETTAFDDQAYIV